MITACAAPPRALSSPRPAPGPAQPSAPGSPLLLPELQRPTSEADEWVPSAAYPVFITKAEILAGVPARSVLHLPAREQRTRSGVGAENKDSELGGYILPLARAIAARTCQADGHVQPLAIIHVDREMQYRVLIEVLYTLSELGYKQLFIATRAAPDVDGHPGWRGVRLRIQSSADFQIVLRKNGLWLMNREQIEFGGECRALSPQPTGTPSAGLTLSELQRCVESLLGEDGAVHLMPEGDLPVQTVLPLLQAFGKKRAVTPAFPTLAPIAGGTVPLLPSGAEVASPTVGDAAHVVEGMRQPFRDCYRQELSARSDAAGTIKLTLRVDATGTVSNAAIEVSGNLPTTGECVRTVAKAAQFRPPEGGSAVIQVPITFVKDAERITQKLPCVAAPRPY